MSINNLPNGLYTRGSIQVRANSGVVSSEPNQLPSIIVPYQPYQVIVRRNIRRNQEVGSYTITGTGDPLAIVTLINVDVNNNYQLIGTDQVNDYGRFDIDVELPWYDNPSYRLLMKNGSGSLQSDTPTQVLLPIVAVATTNPDTDAIIIKLADNVIIGDDELIELTVDGGTSWNSYTLNNFDEGVELRNGTYPIGMIRMRRASNDNVINDDLYKNQVSDEYTLPLNIISPYKPISIQLTELDGGDYKINGIGAIGATVTLSKINDVELDGTTNTTVGPYGEFVLEFNYHEYPSEYWLVMTGSY